jgi:outer membrane protein OmpA-like peptidoglycan-associated protein
VTNADDPGSRAEQLIGIADRLAHEPVPPNPRRLWIPIAAGLLLIIGGGVAIKYGLDSSDSSAGPTGTAGVASAAKSVSTNATIAGNTTTATVAATTTASASPSTTVASSTSVAASTTTPTTVATTTVPSTTVPTTAASPSNVLTSPDPATNPVRWAEFTGGKVYLRGKVPDQATADEIIAKAGAALGAGNVVDEYQVIAGSPRPLSAPLYIRDSVLFAPNSSVISKSAAAVLDLGILLMKQNPKVTTDILGHTDDTGTDEFNLALSNERVQAIADYIVFNGIDASRLTKTGYGESRPIADNSTPEGQALNRRVEFTVNNLLS